MFNDMTENCITEYTRMYDVLYKCIFIICVHNCDLLVMMFNVTSLVGALAKLT